MKKKLAIVVGARPNFIKAAPLIREIKKISDKLDFSLVHTGQHFDQEMSDIFFNEMNIPEPEMIEADPNWDKTKRFGRVQAALLNKFKNGAFSGVVVFGDVDSTLIAALAAKKAGLDLFHIESGLRSYDDRMPEEKNRIIVDNLSDLLFTTEPAGNDNLLKEGMSLERIKFVGNIMIDSLEFFKDRIENSAILDEMELKRGEYILATIHRRENVSDPRTIEDILKRLADLNKYYCVIFPIHPGTRIKIADYGLDSLLQKIRIIEPLGYFDFLKLASTSKGVVTDSGGIQEETTHLGVPCCTFRDNTERPITVDMGSNKLFSIKNEEIAAILKHFDRQDIKKESIPLWDSRVAKRIINELLDYFYK